MATFQFAPIYTAHTHTHQFFDSKSLFFRFTRFFAAGRAAEGCLEYVIQLRFGYNVAIATTIQTLTQREKEREKKPTNEKFSVYSTL